MGRQEMEASPLHVTVRFLPKRALTQKGRSPDSQVVAFQPPSLSLGDKWPLAGRSLHTVAGPRGILTRFPFSLAQRASTFLRNKLIEAR
jgi:hypothetical protein